MEEGWCESRREGSRAMVDVAVKEYSQTEIAKALNTQGESHVFRSLRTSDCMDTVGSAPIDPVAAYGVLLSPPHGGQDK
jgi:hypothetical protein